MATTPILGAGSEVGPYRIEALLGQGGMGVVYRARDVRLDRAVALKLLSPDLAGDERFRARFERESRLAASIDHAGIVPVYEAGDADGVTYIAMRYVDGSDLAKLLASDGPLEPARALELVGQLADALDAAHARGLVHRDVKPGNTLVAREGHVYLADFGLTKTSGRDSMTVSGQLAGTVAYLAPEVIRGEEPTPASDLYALGCVLFECLTGELPFPGQSPATVIYGHLELPAPRVPELPAFDAVFARALAKDPAKRYGSGAELVAAGRAALGARRAHRRRSRRPLVALATAGVAVAAAAFVLWPSESPGIAAIATDAVALIDPREPSLQARVELDGPPSSVAVAPGRDLGRGRSRRDGLPDRPRDAHAAPDSDRRARAERAGGRPRRRLGRQRPGRHGVLRLGGYERGGRHDRRREPVRRLPARRRPVGPRRLRRDGPSHRPRDAPPALRRARGHQLVRRVR